MARTKKEKTELVIILDKSGSMGGLEKDVVGGYNTLIKEQRKSQTDVIVTTILFDTTYYVINNRVPIKNVLEMSLKDYRPSGCTALLDAVGDAINNLKNQYSKKGCRVPEHIIFSIMTDGLENASSKFRYPLIKEMIEEQKKAGWDFIFQAANIDAIGEGNRLGISEEDIAEFAANSEGVSLCFCMMKDMVDTKISKKKK